MRPRHRFALALLAVPLAATLAACGTGGGDDEKVAPATAPAARDAGGGADFGRADALTSDRPA
jgi:hypothetical protein